MTQYFAHKFNEAWEDLVDHSYLVSSLAGLFGLKIGYPNICRFIGANHDIGKSSNDFLERLKGNKDNVDHSTAALKESAYYFKDMFTNPSIDTGRVLKSLLNVFIGHHGGLSNFNEVQTRFKKEIPQYDSSYFQTCPEIYDEVQKLSSLDQTFSLPNAIRMIFSCIVDADAISTEFFMNNRNSQMRHSRINQFQDWDYYEKFFMNIHNNKFSKSSDTVINKARKEVFGAAIKASELRQGFFSLTAPVGLAKTLACIIFSILHAKKYHKSRIVYVMPYNTIIEQNADTLRKFLGDDHVVEHHSDFDFTRKNSDGTKGDYDHASKLLSTNWDAPFVISSVVQLLDSLYSNKVSKCRKLHNLYNSIIIFDEFQTIPPDKVKPILKMLRLLKEEYNVTILFTTATLPHIQKSPWMDFGIIDIQEIIEDPIELYHRTQRVKETIIKERLTYDNLCQILVDSHKEHKQTLCVLNYKIHVRAILDRIKAIGIKAYSLSTEFTPKNRKKILANIIKDLNEDAPFICITTPIIEAGVDIDFPSVYKQASGRDSEEQAKGRCNRHGNRPIGYFYRFQLYENDPNDLFNVQTGINNAILFNHEGDTNCLELVKKYMENYYKNKAFSRYRMDKDNIMDACKNLDFLEMAKFKVIDENITPVICPHTPECVKSVEEFKQTENPQKYFKKFQPYTLSLYDKSFAKLTNTVRVEEYHGVLIINPEDVNKVYDETSGMRL